jgi:hypothetical protein
MNETLSMVLIGAVGPVLTIAVTKIFEILQKRQEQRQQYEASINRALFDKKIPIADTAVSQLTHMKTLIHMVRDIIDMMAYASMGQLSLDRAVLLATIDEIKNLTEQVKSYDTSLAWLYFDLKQDIGSLHSMSDVLSAFSPAISLPDALETKVKNDSLTEVDKINAVKIVIKSMLTLSEFLKSIEDDISENLRVIKSDINQLPRT